MKHAHNACLSWQCQSGMSPNSSCACCGEGAMLAVGVWWGWFCLVWVVSTCIGTCNVQEEVLTQRCVNDSPHSPMLRELGQMDTASPCRLCDLTTMHHLVPTHAIERSKALLKHQTCQPRSKTPIRVLLKGTSTLQLAVLSTTRAILLSMGSCQH